MAYRPGGTPTYLRLTITASLVAAVAILVVVATWLAAPRPSRVTEATTSVRAEMDSVFARADYERASKRYLNLQTLQAGDSGKFAMGPPRLNVVQVVDGTNLIARTWVGYGDEQRELMMWISDFPTNSLVDGDGAPVPGPFKVLGTKSYATAIGSQRTIWHLSPMPIPAAE